MLTSLAFIFLVGMALGWAAARLRLPSLLGMLLTGILLGPSVLNVLDDSLLGISADLRQLALIIILTRAGLSLNLEDLKRVGRPAILLCFVPACFEMAGMVVLAPRLLGLSLLDSAILGAVVASRLSQKYAKLWVAAEVLLFVLVGATVDVDYALASGAGAVLAILGALIFRMAGVFVCLMGTSLTGKQRLFTMMAYTPKATVQAAIGSIPLSMGLACGSAVLTVAVLAILITAPLGAFAIDLSYSRLLSQAPPPDTCQEGERI